MFIMSHFTKGGHPKTGLSPTLSVWEIGATDTKIVNSAAMTEVGDGFYKYEFTAYNPTKEYGFISDAGPELPPNERYGTNATEESKLSNFDKDDLVDRTWDEAAIEHLIPGSTGAYHNEMHADINQLRLDVTTALDLLRLLLKYEQNRTKLDAVNKTLTVFDDDGITPIKVFNLFDRNGNPSIEEVFERVPQ